MRRSLQPLDFDVTEQSGPFRTAALMLAVASAVLCFDATCFDATLASAQPSDEALTYYERGRELYAQGQYGPAAEQLELALELDPNSPTLIYNLARVYELMGELERSLVYYDEYTAALPAGETEERARIEATKARLRGAIESGQATPAETAPPPAAEIEAPQPRYVSVRGVADAPFFILMGVGVAALIGGGVTGVLALGKKNAVEDFVLPTDGSFEQRMELQDQAGTLALISDISLGVGGALCVGALLLYLLRKETYEELPSGARAGLRGGVSLDPNGGFLLSLGGTL